MMFRKLGIEMENERSEKVSKMGDDAEGLEEDDEEEVADIQNDRQFGAAEEGQKKEKVMMFRRQETDMKNDVMANVPEEGGWETVERRGRRGNQHQNVIIRALGGEVRAEEDAEEEEELQLFDVIDSADVWQLQRRARHMLHAYWLQEIHSNATRELKELAGEYQEATKKVKQAEGELKLNLLRRCRVLGMTTAGAARHHELLVSLKVKTQNQVTFLP